VLAVGVHDQAVVAVPFHAFAQAREAGRVQAGRQVGGLVGPAEVGQGDVGQAG
jgi:hypothetical protein